MPIQGQETPILRLRNTYIIRPGNTYLSIEGYLITKKNDTLTGSPHVVLYPHIRDRVVRTHSAQTSFRFLGTRGDRLRNTNYRDARASVSSKKTFGVRFEPEPMSRRRRHM